LSQEEGVLTKKKGKFTTASTRDLVMPRTGNRRGRDLRLPPELIPWSGAKLLPMRQVPLQEGHKAKLVCREREESTYLGGGRLRVLLYLENLRALRNNISNESWQSRKEPTTKAATSGSSYTANSDKWIQASQRKTKTAWFKVETTKSKTLWGSGHAARELQWGG